MSRIPQNFIDDLLSSTDVVEVIDARVPLKKKGKEYTACCPFHNEKTPSFTVSRDKQFYHCFGCGAHGTALGFLMNYENLSFVEAIESLAQAQGLEVPYEQGSNFVQKKPDEKNRLFNIMAAANTWYQKQLRQHQHASTAIAYLKERALSGEITREFGIGFAPESWDGLLKALAKDDKTQKLMLQLGLLRQSDSGKLYDYFRNRIQFPIHDYMGRIIGFGGRIIGEGQPKYLNSPDTRLFHKGRELYGLYQARKSLKDTNSVIVVEGYMDVVALHQFGIRHVVATLGTATTEEHLKRLYRSVKKIIFCFDGDRAGKDAALKAMRTILALIREGRMASFMFLPEGHDPDSFVRAAGKKSFLSAADAAIKLEDFIFTYAKGKSAPDSISGKAGFLEHVKPLVRQLAAGAYRDMLIQNLSGIVNMSEDRLESYIFAIKSTQRPAVRQTHTKPKRHNLVHRALAYLLSSPGLANSISNLNILKTSQNPDIKLLVEMLESANEFELSAAALYERFVDKPGLKDNLNTINSEQNMLRGELDSGFIDTIQNIEKQIENNRFSQDLARVNSGQDLNRLIKNKSKSAK